MKLRYYMRGLGIGVLVTAILMSVTLDGKTEKLTDAEIIERAKELGMEEKYESTVLSDTLPENAEETEKETEPEEEIGQEEDVTADSEQIQEIVTDVPKEPESSEKPENPDEPEIPEKPEAPAETVQITVQGGDGSMTVASKLKAAGMIEDVAAYDKFLCRNGYDKKICTGTHTIPVGATEEEIAKIITTRSR